MKLTKANGAAGGVGFEVLAQDQMPAIQAGDGMVAVYMNGGYRITMSTDEALVLVQMGRLAAAHPHLHPVPSNSGRLPKHERQAPTTA